MIQQNLTRKFTSEVRIPNFSPTLILMLKLYIPTFNDYPHDFDQLFQLWNTVHSYASEQTLKKTLSNENEIDFGVTFDFSQCRFLRQNAVAFLGGLTRSIQEQGGVVHFALDTFDKKVRDNLTENGFLSTLGFDYSPWSGNSIPYREDTEQDKEVLIDYLKTMWLGRGWVHVSLPLRDAIVGRVWEIYANAFEHSQSSIGIYSCGQHYPRLGFLKLTVVDFGVGIPSNVRTYMQKPKITADSALRWAFQRGTTTKPNGMGRGMGLDLLKDFVNINKGRLEIFSGEGYASIDEDGEKYSNRQIFFEGTLVNITFKCDESYYQLASEAADEPLF